MMIYHYNSPVLGIELDLPNPSILNSREVYEELEDNIDTAASLAGLLVEADEEGRAWRGIEGSRLEVNAYDDVCSWTLYDAEGGVIDSDSDWKRLPAFLDEQPESSMMVINP